MRDDSLRWDRPFANDATLIRNGWTARPVELPPLTLLSGPAVCEQMTDPLIGWPDIATGDRYALRLRRDRVMQIGATAEPDGWNTDRMMAISDVSDGYSGFEITGGAAIKTLQQGAEISIESPSRSVARSLFGIPGLVFRKDSADRFYWIVSRPLAQTAWRTLQSIH